MSLDFLKKIKKMMYKKTDAVNFIKTGDNIGKLTLLVVIKNRSFF